MKQVREQSDAQAYVVLNRKGEHRATVQFRFGSGGGVQCDVWSISVDPEYPESKPYMRLSHQKKAGGYGYDKATAALSGAVIDGYAMANHCGRVEPAGEKKREALMRAYIRAASKGITHDDEKVWRDKAHRIGCSFANYSRSETCPKGPDGYGYRWLSLHSQSGLDRLQAMGYTIIHAL